MSEKRVIWYHGKKINATILDRNSPITGEPNTWLTFYDNDTGEIHRIRIFDERGNAKKDYDRGYIETKEPFDHSHIWNGKKRGKGKLLSKRERNFFDRKKRKLKKKGGRF